MGDLTKILEGNVEEVKSALAGLSHVDLQALRKEEVAGKNRTGVLTAVDAALESPNAGAADTDTLVPHDPTDPVDPFLVDRENGIEAATDFEASGAPHQVVPGVDLSHPAVDADPRAHTTAEQNRIDFNDPTLSGPEAVAKNLAEGAPAQSDT